MKSIKINASRCLQIFILSPIILVHSVLAQSEMPEELPNPYPTALTIVVSDEDENPIPDAKLLVGFHDPFHPKIRRRGEPEWFKELVSSKEGLLRVEERTYGDISVYARKKGYYPSNKEYNWDIYANWKQVDTEQRLIPWNPTMKMMLKEIGDPVPMSVMPDFGKELPGIGKEYAMDLMVGDWLPPHGKGKQLDCYFSVVGSLASSKLLMRFPNLGDGVIRVDGTTGIESDLRFPREAPALGYSDKAEISKVYDSYEYTPSFAASMASGFIFRIRTPKGDVDSDQKALHGKLVDFSSFTGVRETKGSAFGPMWLYINPNPGDRRIEADLTRNLRKGEDPPKYP